MRVFGLGWRTVRGREKERDRGTEGERGVGSGQ